MPPRGRKPTLGQVREVMGTDKKRPARYGPAFAAGTLTPPKRWRRNGLERQEWERIVPELVRTGVAKGVHQGALEKICELHAAGVALYRLRDYRGARMATDAHRKAAAEFGLTPASQDRVAFTSPDTPEDPGEKFFPGPRLER